MPPQVTAPSPETRARQLVQAMLARSGGQFDFTPLEAVQQLMHEERSIAVAAMLEAERQGWIRCFGSEHNLVGCSLRLSLDFENFAPGSLQAIVRGGKQKVPA